MNLTTTWQGRVLVATLKGELGMKDHATLEAAITEMAEADATGIVLNFADVIYIASMGIGLLMKLVKQTKERGIAVRLASPRPAIKMLLEMVRLESALPTDASLDESLAQLQAVAA